MGPTNKRANVECRVALVEPGSRTLLALQLHNGPRLPRILISARQRWARQIQCRLERDWHLSGAVAEFLPFNTCEPHCVVVELLTTDFPIPFQPTRIEELASTELSDRERDDLSAILDDRTASPVSRIGWIDDALRWIEEMTGLHSCVKRSIEQYNAGRGFALLRVPVQDGQCFWLKATSFPNEHERGLTKLLSNLCPEALPMWISERSDWNAWLMADDRDAAPPPSLRDEASQYLVNAVKSLAKLQSRTVGKETALLHAGAFDQSMSRLRSDTDPLFSFIAEAMQHAVPDGETPMKTDRLDELQQIFETSCRSIERLGIPPTILHGDMSLSNLLFTNCGCQFLDWSDGYVGLPLVTLRHLLLLNPCKIPDERAAVNEGLKRTYRNAVEGIPADAIEAGFIWMPFMAAASTLYGRGDWLHTGDRHDARHYSFARRMATHMDCAARQLPARCIAMS